jgi:hypothetical protein
VQGQAVELLGRGGDSDETPAIAAYEWTLDGSASPFATSAGATLPTTNLSPGRHTIAYRVRDTEGEFSDPQTISVDISPSGPQQTQTWTFLLYLDGDNANTALFLNRNTPLGVLYRLEHTPPVSNVRVVALYDGDFPGGGDTFRYIQQADGHFSQESLGELNMGDPQTLVDFVRWGKQQAPADNYYLSIADHANSIDGIAWDFTSARTEHLTNAELRQALGTITENGTQPIDVLHFDGCLMGLVENAYQMGGLARYLIVSENLGWSAFAYEAYRAAVGKQMDAKTFAISVADRYAQQVGAFDLPYTISALDLTKLDDLTLKTDALAGELLRYALASAANRSTLAALRSQVQKFDSNGSFTITNEDEYVDLDHWAALVQSGVNDSAVQSAATALRGAIPGLVIREHHLSGLLSDSNGSSNTVNLDNARGIGIYYPPQASVKTYQTYARGDLTFSVETRWVNFLAAGLAALPFDPSEPVPNPIAPLPLTGVQRVYLSRIQR